MYKTASWKRKRGLFLYRNPTCYGCGQPATQVDHIDGNAQNMAWANLQPLCHSCHSRKTYHHDGSFGRPVRR